LYLLSCIAQVYWERTIYLLLVTFATGTLTIITIAAGITTGTTI